MAAQLYGNINAEQEMFLGGARVVTYHGTMPVTNQGQQQR